MEFNRSARRLIVNADDFGRSSGINAAVVRAHRDGILTTASLMVNEEGCAQAVALARSHPRLGVGLHLSLVCGRAALGADRIPGLVDSSGRFGDEPVKVGWRYFSRPAVRDQLRAEMQAQFDKFHATGLPLDHLNGHLHLHLHPTIFEILLQQAEAWGVRHLRLTREPFWLNARLQRGRWAYRISHAIIYCWLAARSQRALRGHNIRHTQAVFGLLQDGNVNESYLVGLLPRLPAGDSELYAHPALGESEHELRALTSPRVRRLVDTLGIELIRYQDL